MGNPMTPFVPPAAALPQAIQTIQLSTVLLFSNHYIPNSKLKNGSVFIFQASGDVGGGWLLTSSGVVPGTNYTMVANYTGTGLVYFSGGIVYLTVGRTINAFNSDGTATGWHYSSASGGYAYP